MKLSQNLLAASRPLSGIFIYTIRKQSEARYVSGMGNHREVSNRTLRALRRAFVFIKLLFFKKPLINCKEGE